MEIIFRSRRPWRGPYDRGDRMSISLSVPEIWGQKRHFHFFWLFNHIRCQLFRIVEYGIQLNSTDRCVSSSSTIVRANTFLWKHILWSYSPQKLTPFRVFKNAKTACFAIALSRLPCAIKKFCWLYCVCIHKLYHLCPWSESQFLQGYRATDSQSSRKVSKRLGMLIPDFFQNRVPVRQNREKTGSRICHAPNCDTQVPVLTG